MSLFTPRNHIGWALDGGQRSTSVLVRPSDGNESRYILNRKLCGPQTGMVFRRRQKSAQSGRV